MIRSTIPYDKFKFPSGELQIVLQKDLIYRNNPTSVTVYFEYQNNEEILELLLLCDTLKRFTGKSIDLLHMPYVPFSRQDRQNCPEECFSLAVFANLINSIGADSVLISDPHSDVTPALIERCKIIPQHKIMALNLQDEEGFWLISPDSGAMKKIHKLAQITNTYGVVECSKIRNTKTGEITATVVHSGDLLGKDCYIVDDICDGGKTFIEIAKVLKTKNCGKIVLMVTHGLFTKGLSVFDDLIDEIYVKNERVK